MAITLLQNASKSAGTVASSTLAYPSNVTAGSLKVAYVVGTAPLGASDNLDGAYHNDVTATNAYSAAILTKSGAAAGATTVTFTQTGTSSYLQCIIEEWSGIAAASALDQTVSAVGGVSTAVDSTATPATTQASELVLSLIGVNSGNYPLSYGGGFVGGTNANAYHIYQASLIVSATGAQRMTATLNAGDTWTAMVATYKAAGSGILHQADLAGQATGAATTSFTYSGSLAVSAGWFAAVFINCNQIVTQVSDNNGHNATAIVLLGNTGVNNLYLAYFENTPAVAAWTPKVTAAVAANIVVCASFFSGLAAFGSLDRIAFSTGNSTSLSSGATAATRQNNELVLGCGEVENFQTVTWTQGAGFLLSSHVDTGITTEVGMLEYKIVSATGAQTAAATWAASDSPKPWGFGCVTFSDTPIPPSPLVLKLVPVTAATLADATGTIDGVALGNTIVVVAAIWNNASGGVNTAPTVTDTTLSLALTAALAPAGTANGGANTNLQCGIWFLPSGSVTAGTHVIDLHSTCGNITHIDMAILEVSGLTASPLDVSASAIGSTAQALTAGPTGATAQALEVALAVVAQRALPGVANAAFACSGYTLLMQDSVTTDGLGAFLCYQIINAVGAPSAIFSWADATTTASQAAVALLKAGAGVAPSAGQRLMLLGVGS